MSSSAYAACTNPAGVGGEFIYNTDFNVMQYCNNTDWVGMGGSSGGGGTGVTDGDKGDVTVSGTGASWLIDDDALDFTELADTLTLDASTGITVSGSNVLSITNTGTGNSFVVNDQTTDTTPFVIAPDGKVGIGVATPLEKLSVLGNIQLGQGTDSVNGDAWVFAHDGTTANSNILFLGNGTKKIYNDTTGVTGGGMLALYSNGSFAPGRVELRGGGTTGIINMITNGASRLIVDADGGISVGSGVAANASALVDLTSTTKGFLPPRMTTTQRNAIASPADGLIVYDTDLSSLYIRANGTWTAVGSGGGSSSPLIGTLSTVGATASIAIPGGNEHLLIVLNGVSHSNAGSAGIRIALSSNGGSSYGSAIPISSGSVGSSTNLGGAVVIYNSGNTGVAKNITWESATPSATGAAVESTITGVINFIQFSSSIGSLDGGSVSIYKFNVAGGGGGSASAADDAGAIQFNAGSGAFGGDEAMLFWDNTNKKLGIGTATPGDKLSVVDENNLGIRFTEYNDLDGANIRGMRARGTIASPTAVLADDRITGLTAFGYDGSAFTAVRGQLGIYAAENYTSTAQGSYVRFDTTTLGGTTITERMRLDANGGVSIGSAANAAASSILDLTSTAKGFLPPRMTTAQRTAIASPANGLVVYDTDLNTLHVYNGTVWISTSESSTPFTAAFTDSAFVQDQGATTTQNFTNLNIGAAAADRNIVAVIGGAWTNGGVAFSVSTVTIGGVTATKIHEASSAHRGASYWIANVPSGTTATVAITYPMDMSMRSVSVYRITGLASTTPTSTNTVTTAGASTNLPLTFTQNSVGIVAGVCANAWPTATWTKATENMEANDTSAVGHTITTASYTTSTHEGSQNIGLTWSASCATYNSVSGIVLQGLSGGGGGTGVTDGDKGDITVSGTGANWNLDDDVLDFTEFKDALTLDASTDIAMSGSNVLSLTNSGTGNSFVVNDQASDTTPFVIDAAGNVAIGAATVTTGAALDVVGTTTTNQIVLKSVSGAAAPGIGSGSARQLMIVNEQQPDGTAAGTAATTWTARSLNTTQYNSIAGAALASNAVTLPAGVYRIFASAPAYSITYHQARLYNVTGATVLLAGTSSFSAASTAQTLSVVEGVITLGATTVIRLDHMAGSAGGANGAGVATVGITGVPEVYSTMTIEKLQ